MKPLLSIAIATKNRVQYCIQTIETILDFKYDNFELVIQDNTDNEELKKYVEAHISDPRLIYNYTPPPFSSIDNFNAVLNLSSGEYVCLLGDDDGITSNLFKVVEWAKTNNIDSVCPKVFVHYIWPNGAMNGKMVIPYSTQTVWSNVPSTNIQALVNDGVVQYMHFNLPKLYHGVVKMSCLDEIKNRTGNYLGGLSPDVYASVALTSVVKNHIVIDSPLTIAGACPKSTTVESNTDKHSGKIEDAPHFRSRENYIWDKNVPRYYSVETIWAESALKAMEENAIKADLSKLNVIKILASATNKAPSYGSLFLKETFEIWDKKRYNASFKIKLALYRSYLFVEDYGKRIVHRIPRKYFFKHYRYTNIKDIATATEKTENILNKIDIKKMLHEKPALRKI